MASEWADIRHEREAREARAEVERRIDAMVEESEGVAANIRKVEVGLERAKGEGRRVGGWMDVVMG